MATDDESAHASQWERWTDDWGPFYRSCAVFPFDPLFDDRAETAGDAEKPDVEFTTGITRVALRNLPALLLIVLAVYVPTRLLRYATEGRVSIAVPSLDMWTAVLLVPGLLIGALWLYLLYRIVGPTFGGYSIHRTVVFFATAIPLSAGTAHAVYYAWRNVGSGADPAVTVQAGYFLFVLVTGHLVYDGLALRTEHLFARLGTSSVVDRDAYAAFYEQLSSTLGATIQIGPVELSRSVAFAVAIGLVPITLPVLIEPWPWVRGISYLAYSLMTLFVVAMLYDVFVLVYMFTELLRRDVLTYQPFHPDEHGGFHDLGRFAARVNVILVVAGGYVAYRFYAEGILNLPAGTESPLLAVTWAVLYLGPIAAYLVLVVFWLYHSFWRLHRTMERGRKERMGELQRAAREEGDAPDYSTLEIDAPAWESLQSAPTWPIKRQGMIGILVVDAIPVLSTFVL